MKNLIYSMALVSLPLSAQQIDIIGTIPNKDNNKITFTGHRGNCEEGSYMAYAQADGGRIGAFGCYRLVSDQLFVVWGDGDIYTYNVEDLTFTEEANKALQRNRKK
jgi:hypothetical protein